MTDTPRTTTSARPILACLVLLLLAGACALGAWAGFRAARLGSLAARASVPVLLALGLTALAAATSARWRGRAAIAAMALALGLWLADLVLVVLPPPRRAAPPMPSVAESVAALRSRGESVVPAVLPLEVLRIAEGGAARSMVATAEGELVPLGGIAGVATLVQCFEAGPDLHYVSDEFGFHNPPDLWRPGDIEILAVGDSFAHAACVPSGEEAMGRLRRRFPHSVNLAMASNGPLVELAALVEYAMYLEPRVVLWFYFEGNDLVSNIELEKLSPILMSYLDGGTQRLLERRASVDRALSTFVEAGLAAATRETSGSARSPRRTDAFGKLDRRQIRNILLLRHLRDRLDLTAGRLGFDFSTLRRVLTRGRDVVEGWNGRLYLVYLPAPWRFHGTSTLRSFEDQRRAVLGIADEIGIGVIDVAEALAGREDGLDFYVVDGLHFNARGQALTAAVIARSLAREPLAGQLTRARAR